MRRKHLGMQILKTHWNCAAFARFSGPRSYPLAAHGTSRENLAKTEQRIKSFCLEDGAKEKNARTLANRYKKIPLNGSR